MTKAYVVLERTFYQSNLGFAPESGGVPIKIFKNKTTAETLVQDLSIDKVKSGINIGNYTENGVKNFSDEEKELLMDTKENDNYNYYCFAKKGLKKKDYKKLVNNLDVDFYYIESVDLA